MRRICSGLKKTARHAGLFFWLKPKVVFFNPL
jgi:hypothetical protein